MKSQFKIELALFKFGERRPLDSLTISILSKLAGINRVTFYKSYRSMHDLLKTVLLKNIFIDSKTIQKEPSLENSLTLLMQFIEQHQAFCRNLVQSSYRSMVADFIQNEVMYNQLAEFKRLEGHGVVSDLERKVASKFFAAGMTTTFIDWIDSNYQHPSEDIYRATLQVAKGFVERFIQKKVAK